MQRIDSKFVLLSIRKRQHMSSTWKSKLNNKTYACWIYLLSRVRHQPTASYIGATVSEEWKLFENFLRDMGEVPEGKSLDRINANKPYSKENCRWATRTEQSRNARKCLFRKTVSKHKGVCLLKNGRWQVYIRTGEKRLYVGRFETETAAALAYNEAAKKYHGEFACLNNI